MGIWDEYCLVCAGPLYNAFNGRIEIYDKNDTPHKIAKKEYDWLNETVVITSENEVINNCTWLTDSCSEAKCKNKVYTITPINYHAGFNVDGYGIICHEACYKLIESKLKHKIIFSDVCRKLAVNNCIMKKKSIYGKITKYHSQFFDFYSAYDENSYLLENPTNNKENQKRIIDGWTDQVTDFKKTPPRKSPCESATIFSVGTIMKGSDGKKWTIKKVGGIKKWMIYDENKKIKTKTKSKSRSKKKL